MDRIVFLFVIFFISQRKLSKNYIYFNDDFTLTAPVCWSDFYTEDKGTKVYIEKDWGKIYPPNPCDEGFVSDLTNFTLAH